MNNSVDLFQALIKEHVDVSISINSFPSGPHSPVGNMSDCRYVSDFRSGGHKFDLSLVP